MEHPITPPPELVQRLCDAAFLRGADGVSKGEIEVSLILEAFAAGADQEFEACCAEVSWFTADKLRAARRPKPPSLKEQALKALDHICVNHSKATDHECTIRRALEALPND
jgi:hypothetical protein